MNEKEIWSSLSFNVFHILISIATYIQTPANIRFPVVIVSGALLITFVFLLVWANESYTKVVDMIYNNWCIIKIVLMLDSGENDVTQIKTNYVSCKKIL